MASESQLPPRITRVVPDAGPCGSTAERKETAMRTLSILALVLTGFAVNASVASAQQADDCKLCREVYRACAKNHSQAACKTELDICMKHCRKK